MIISFGGPVFFAAADEACFFRWLASLPGYESVRGIGTTLALTFDGPIEPDATIQLLVMFRRWRIDITPLLPLRTPETDCSSLWDTPLDGPPGTGTRNSFEVPEGP